MTKGIDSSTNFHKSTFHFLVIILFSRVFLRFFHCINNRSLWEDKVFLVSRLITINFSKPGTSPGFVFLCTCCEIFPKIKSHFSRRDRQKPYLFALYPANIDNRYALKTSA